MKTLSILSCKGGTGKTTLALHLAVAAQGAGRGVLVADLDRQRSCLDWRRERGAAEPGVEEAKPGSLFTLQLAAQRLGTELMIIDTASSREEDSAYAIKCADLCLIVVRPHFLDLRAVEASARMVHQLCRPGAFVINQAPAKWTGREAIGRTQVTDMLRPMGLPIAHCDMRMRPAYHLGLPHGRTAQEIEPEGAAACEVASLWRYVEGLLWSETFEEPLLRSA